MAQTSTANTNFKLAQVYIDYNTDGFGFKAKARLQTDKSQISDEYYYQDQF